jgi:1-aminocyclopropane-1-carboxylate deaminase/D-cysteine desulfhydrase-like pyridoxal-dependent ACC family enzyme
MTSRISAAEPLGASSARDRVSEAGRPALPVPARRETWLMAEAPELASRVPWRPLAHTPTPVEPAAAAEPYLGRGGVWIKRDDLVSPLYGGNKVRRFEHLLADAEQRGARELITVGGLASTQVLATVLFGRAAGFDVSAVLFDQPVTSFVRRALLTSAMSGARLIYGGGYARTAYRTYRAWRAIARSQKPYFIGPGASSGMANLGYVDAMFELDEQVRRGLLPRPDVIVTPSGSGGTLAGLAVGAAILGWPTLLLGVRITDLIACNRATIRYRIEATARYLAERAPRFTRRRLTEARFGLHHGAIGGGYGHPTKEAIEAVRSIELLTGSPGEITYSGKALAGLRAIAREHPDKSILFWHTLSSVGPDTSAASPSLVSAMDPAFARFFEGEVLI